MATDRQTQANIYRPETFAAAFLNSVKISEVKFIFVRIHICTSSGISSVLARNVCLQLIIFGIFIRPTLCTLVQTE